MTQDTKFAGALLAVGVLCVLLIFALSLSYLTNQGLYALDPEDIDTELRFPWRIGAFFIELGTGINLLLGGFIFIISTATGWITETFKKKWQLAGVVILCLLGILASLYVLIDTNDEAIAQLRFFGNLYDGSEDAKALEETRTGLNWLCGELIAAFTFFLGSRLGIERAESGGPVRRKLKEFLGEGAER